MALIYIVEDDQNIREIESFALKNSGYTIMDFECAKDFYHQLAEKVPDCILLDIMLPGMDGLAVCRALREEHVDPTPILMLTARDTVADRVTGLDCGADDYLVKPFSMKELDARLRALVRRARGRQTRSVLRWEDIELDPAAHSATRSGVPLRLSPTGFVILETLLRAAPAVVPRTELEQAIWGDFPPDSDALRTHIHELRQKLDKPFTCPLLKTIPHVGYTLVRHE